MISPRPDKEHTYFLVGPGLARSPHLKGSADRLFLCLWNFLGTFTPRPSPPSSGRVVAPTPQAADTCHYSTFLSLATSWIPVLFGGRPTLLARQVWLRRALRHSWQPQGSSPSTWPRGQMLSLNPRRLCGGGLPIGWVRCDLVLLLSPKASPLTPLLAAHTCLPGTPFVRLAVSMTFRTRWPRPSAEC